MKKRKLIKEKKEERRWQGVKGKRKKLRKGSGSRMGSMQEREVGAGWEACKEGKWEQDGKYARKGSGSRIGSM